jgi:D-threo-aldose 1-dehydrogenase
MDLATLASEEVRSMKFATKRVGRTSVEVTSIGLGGATLGGSMQAVQDADARLMIVDAFDSGVRYFDTAPLYGYGRSEHIVGDELRYRPEAVISTKVGRRLRPRRQPQAAGDQWQQPFPFEFYFDYSYDGIMRSYEDSLQRLGMNRIDILLLHDVDSFTHGKEAQPAVFTKAMDGAYKAMAELRAAGEVKAIGIGVNEAKPIADALAYGQWDCFLLAGRYTLLEQAPLVDLLPAVGKHGASIIVGGPFNSGILVGGDTWNYTRAPEDLMRRAKAMAEVCAAHKVPLPTAALKFPLAHPVVASVIPGPRTTSELNQILAWWDHPVPAALWSDLKSERLIEASAPVPA